LGQRKLPEHLVLTGKHSIAIGFLGVDGNSFTSRLKNWNELVGSDRSIQYQLWRDLRSPAITGKAGLNEIDKLNHTKHGQFLTMDEEQRVDFEFIYSLIIDIQNHDLEIELQEALRVVKVELQSAWICQIFQQI
jgi:hypothetical protein